MSGKSTFAALTIVVAAMMAGQVCAAPECTMALEEKAEDYTSHIKTWPQLLYFYQHYETCDNGAPAEGVSDSVAKLMRYHWSGIAGVRDALNADERFRRFVLSHVDMTWDSDDFAAAEKNATDRCPKGLESFCKAAADELHDMSAYPDEY